ncbi:MAG: hypothetical protein GW917_01130 [Bdellovibrionales bacterium]|nr:hypothetical protein [Bdellovibrionales bacterium]
MSLDSRFMELKIGEQLFALPLMKVKEVIQKPEITQVPNMPSHFEGMINLRGQILGVFNVRKKLNQKSVENGPPEVIIVVESDGLMLGMIVDEVTRVIQASAEQLKEAPLREGDPAAAYVSGVIHSGDDLILTLKVEKLLDLDTYKNQLQKAA